MSNPIHRPVGTRVLLTLKSFGNVLNGNRSIHAFPCDSFVNALRPYVGQYATVTHDFSPSYERNITFDDGKIFQVKDNWVENA